MELYTTLIIIGAILLVGSIPLLNTTIPRVGRTFCFGGLLLCVGMVGRKWDFLAEVFK